MPSALSHDPAITVPGDDLSLEDPRVAEIGAVVHTAEVIAAFKAAQG